MGSMWKKRVCVLSPEQEAGYTVSCAERILRYNGYFLLAILGVQSYNILYTLAYTGWRLHSRASRVYMVFYVALFVVSVIGLVLRRYLKQHLPERARCTVRLQVAYGILLMAWGACVTVYDQRVSDSISVYLMIALTVAMLVYFTPVQAVAAYGGLLVALYFLLPVLREVPGDNYGNQVNLAVMTLMAVFISVYRYISGRRHYLDEQIIMEQNRCLSDAAVRDSLTRLWNRRFLDEQMEGLYGRCADAGVPLTVMMMDIDHFKIYNDTYGHPQGDECLRRMAWRLEQEVDEETEYLIRYGGEEFLYIGVGVDAKRALEKGARFNQVIRELNIGPSEQDRRGITISIGIYTRLPAEAPQWSAYIEEADKALYRAKNSGRDQWVVG